MKAKLLLLAAIAFSLASCASDGIGGADPLDRGADPSRDGEIMSGF